MFAPLAKRRPMLIGIGTASSEMNLSDWLLPAVKATTTPPVQAQSSYGSVPVAIGMCRNCKVRPIASVTVCFGDWCERCDTSLASTDPERKRLKMEPTIDHPADTVAPGVSSTNCWKMVPPRVAQYLDNESTHVAGGPDDSSGSSSSDGSLSSGCSSHQSSYLQLTCSTRFHRQRFIRLRSYSV